MDHGDRDEQVGKIIREEMRLYPDDIEAAALSAVSRLQRQPFYAEIVHELVIAAVRGMVCDARHSANTAMKRQAREYGTPTKVRRDLSKDAVAVTQSLYDYHIGGTVLGNLRRDELLEISSSETARAEGHVFNAKLCQRLAGIVKERTVREAVTQARLRSIFAELQAQAVSKVAS